MQKLGNERLQKRLEGLVKSSLASEGILNPNVPVGVRDAEMLTQ